MKSPRVCPDNPKSHYSLFWLLAPGSWLLSFCFCLLFPAFAAQSQGQRIGSLRFQGNRVFSSDQLQRRLLPAGLIGTPYDPAEFQSQIRRLEVMYREEGYFQASVGPPIAKIQSSDDLNTVAVVIPIAEGPLFTVGEIRIKETGVFPPATLLQMCPLSRGQPFKQKQLDEWFDELKASYREMGYIRFELSSRAETDDTRKVVNLTLDCREGQAYSVASIVVEGDPSINPSEFKKRLLLAEGGRFNPDMISISLYYINQMRIYGSISESDVEIAIDDARLAVDLTFRLHQDRPAASDR